MRILLISYDNDNSIAYFPLGLGYLAVWLQLSRRQGIKKE